MTPVDDSSQLLTDQQWLDRMAPMLHIERPKLIGNGRYAGLSKMIFTTAIITGEVGDTAQYEDRWCYNGHEAAANALAMWDGTGEPTGWVRHPSSGRRVSQTGNEIDDEGNQVAGIGVEYVAR